MDLLREPIAHITKRFWTFGKCKYFNRIKVGCDQVQRFVYQDNAGLRRISVHRILLISQGHRPTRYLAEYVSGSEVSPTSVGADKQFVRTRSLPKRTAPHRGDRCRRKCNDTSNGGEATSSLDR